MKLCSILDNVFFHLKPMGGIFFSIFLFFFFFLLSPYVAADFMLRCFIATAGSILKNRHALSSKLHCVLYLLCDKKKIK